MFDRHERGGWNPEERSAIKRAHPPSGLALHRLRPCRRRGSPPAGLGRVPIGYGDRGAPDRTGHHPCRSGSGAQSPAFHQPATRRCPVVCHEHLPRRLLRLDRDPGGGSAPLASWAVLRDLAAAGLAALAFSALMWFVFGMTGGRPSDASLAGYNLDYPVAIVAAAVAVTMAALPYLSRSVQRLLELVIGLAAVATVVAGDGLPVNVAASVALGWGTAALLHLIFGSPLGLPSGAELAVVLDDLGVPVSALSPAEHQVWGVARTPAPTSRVGPSPSPSTAATPPTPSCSPRPAASSSIGTRGRLSRSPGSNRSSTRRT